MFQTNIQVRSVTGEVWQVLFFVLKIYEVKFQLSKHGLLVQGKSAK